MLVTARNAAWRRRASFVVVVVIIESGREDGGMSKALAARRLLYLSPLGQSRIPLLRVLHSGRAVLSRAGRPWPCQQSSLVPKPNRRVVKRTVDTLPVRLDQASQVRPGRSPECI